MRVRGTKSEDKGTVRCGHFEQVKSGKQWKCLACGQLLTIRASVQNSLEMAEVMRSAFDSKRTVAESLDELLGREEWERLKERIPLARKNSNKKTSKLGYDLHR